MKKLIPERLYSLHPNGYCGVFMPETVMRKIMKLQAKYSNEVRHILMEHKEELYVSDWTCASSFDDNGKITEQVVIQYTTDKNTEIDHRIELFTATAPKHEPEVFMVSNRDEAQEIANLRLQHK